MRKTVEENASYMWQLPEAGIRYKNAGATVVLMHRSRRY